MTTTPAPADTTSTATSVSVEREISASPEQVFALLADPAGHVLLDGSGTVRASRDGNPQLLQLGSRFGMEMHMGIPYRMQNTIVEFEQDRRIAWQQGWGRHVWRYELTPTESGTLVHETFDWGPARARWVLAAMRAPARNTVSMRATLQRMQEHFTHANPV